MLVRLAEGRGRRTADPYHQLLAQRWAKAPGRAIPPGQPADFMFDCSPVTLEVHTFEGWLLVILQMAAVM